VVMQWEFEEVRLSDPRSAGFAKKLPRTMSLKAKFMTQTGLLRYDSFDEVRDAIKGVYTPRRGLFLAAVTVIAFCLVINSSWRATPDSALYLELGQSLARGQGFVYNNEPHTLVPPGYPALVALAAKIGGEGFLTYRILMALMGLLTAGAGYLLVRRLCGPDVAFLAGGLFAVNHVLLLNSTFTASDVPFALCTLIALNAVVSAARSQHRTLWIVAAGLLAGLPALVRVNGWGVAPAAAIFLICSRTDRSVSRHMVLVVTFLAVSVIPGALWVIHKASYPSSFHEGTWLAAISGRGLDTQLSIVLKAAWEYIPETSYALSGASIKTGFLEFVIPGLVLAGLVAAARREERLLVPFTLIQYGGLLLAPAGSRYLIMLLPGLYLFFALGLIRFYQWVIPKMGGFGSTQITRERLVVYCFALLAILNVGANIITIYQARNALQPGGAESQRDLPFFSAAQWLNRHASGGVVMSMHPRIIHYLSGLPSVELTRSGVPEHDAWVRNPELIRNLVKSRKPEFFFSDASDSKLLAGVSQALESLNLRLEEISEARSSSRFALWRIRPKE